MTDREQQQFNQMYESLLRISKGYVSVAQIPRNADRTGLTPQEFMEYAYENIQQEAKNGLHGIRRPKSVVFITAGSGPPIGTKK
jgi:hypothetical protein